MKIDVNNDICDICFYEGAVIITRVKGQVAMVCDNCYQRYADDVQRVDEYDDIGDNE